jgi:hypothetical protein
MGLSWPRDIVAGIVLSLFFLLFFFPNANAHGGDERTWKMKKKRAAAQLGESDDVFPFGSLVLAARFHSFTP